MSYIYIYIHAHTHILVQTSQFTFSRARASEGGTPRRNPPAPLARSRSRSHLLASANAVVRSSKPYHRPLHFSISISRNRDARGFVTLVVVIVVVGEEKRQALFPGTPPRLGLELRPRTHYVVYYLNTNALALALATRRYHGKQEKAHMQWRNVTK